LELLQNGRIVGRNNFYKQINLIFKEKKKKRKKEKKTKREKDKKKFNNVSLGVLFF